jgi:hypothetical protein
LALAAGANDGAEVDRLDAQRIGEHDLQWLRPGGRQSECRHRDPIPAFRRIGPTGDDVTNRRRPETSPLEAGIGLGCAAHWLDLGQALRIEPIGWITRRHAKRWTGLVGGNRWQDALQRASILQLRPAALGRTAAG